jgi:hypothetical protein
MIFNKSEPSKVTSKYLGGDLSIAKGGYDNEYLQLIRGSYLIADTRKHVNFNTRIYGYGGNYTVAGLSDYDGPKSVFGLGGEFGFNGNFKIDKLKIGVGLSGGVFTELGGYYNFRRNADKAGRISSDYGPGAFTFSISPIIAYEFSETTILSGQINLGLPGFITPSVVLNNQGYIYWISWVPSYKRLDDNLGQRIDIGFMMDIRKFGISL